MPRHNDRKFALALETLEGRELQSGLITTSALASTPTVVASNPALISPAAGANIAGHAYHGAVGFFGQ
jgi:hypothetical protein